MAKKFPKGLKILLISSIFAASSGCGFIVGYNGAFNTVGDTSNAEDQQGGDIDIPGGEEDDPIEHIETPSEKLLESLMSNDGIIASGTIDLAIQEDINFHIDLGARVDIRDLENLKLNADATITSGEYIIDADIAFVDNNITLDFDDNHLKMATSTITDIMNFLPELGINIEIPEEFSNLNTMELAIQLGELTEEDKTTYEDGQSYFPFSIAGIDIGLLTDADERDRFLGARIESATFDNVTLSGQVTFMNASEEELNIVNPLEGENADKYVDINQFIGLASAINKLIKQDRFRIEFDALYDYKDEATKDITIGGGLQFDIKELFGYGTLNILDSENKNHEIKVDMKSPKEILFSYNTNLKGKFNTETFKELIEMVKTVISQPDKHFVELFSKFMDIYNNAFLQELIAGNYTVLLEKKLINDLVITNTSISLDVDLSFLNIEDFTSLHIVFNYHESNGETIIDGVSISGLNLGEGSFSLNAYLYDFDESLESTRLNENDTYLDFSDIKILLELGIETSKFEYFHFAGDMNLKLKSSDLINIGIDVDLKIRNVDGNVQVALAISSIDTIVGVNKDAFTYPTRSADIYYADGMFYIHRLDDYKYNDDDNYSRRCTPEYLLDNIITILCHDILGLKDSLMEKITETESEEEVDIDYSKILSGFILTSSTDQTEHYFDIEINMYELTHKDNFKDSDDNDINLVLKVYEDANQVRLNKIEISLDVNAGITLSVSATLTLQDDTSVELTDSNRLSALESFIQAHSNDTLNEWISY